MADKKKEPKSVLMDRALLSEEDQKYISGLRDQANAGDISWKAANVLANKRRAQYGYTGGTDGSDYTPVYTPPKAPEYTPPYSEEELKTAAREISDREKFSYDPEQDPLWQNYREQYAKAGEKAMKDTLAQVSARTGGIASSYGQQAAQDTFDGYMDRLAARLPTLYSLAYELYRDEENAAREDLQEMHRQNSAAEDRYGEAVSRYQADRAYGYRQAEDQREEAVRQENTEYQRRRDAEEDSAEAEKTARELARQKEQEAQRQIQSWLTANNGDVSAIPKELLDAGGYSRAYWDAIGGKIARDAAEKASAGVVSQRSGGSGSGKVKTGATAEEMGIVEKMLSFDTEWQALDYLYSNVPESRVKALKKLYDQVRSGKDVNGDLVSEKELAALCNSVRDKLRLGRKEEATKLAADIWEDLTYKQKEVVNSLLARFNLGFSDMEKREGGASR